MLTLVKKGITASDLRVAKKKIGSAKIDLMTLSISELPKTTFDLCCEQLGKLIKIKNMPCVERRTHALHQTVASSILLDLLSIDIQK